MFGLSVWLLTAAAMAFQDAPSDIVRIHGQPFRITVNSTSTAENSLSRQQIQVEGRLKEAFGDSPIEWNPAEFLDQATLRSTCSAATIRVGRKGQAPVYVEFTRPRLRVGEVAELAVHVENPRELAPGVYLGELVSRFSSPRIGAALEIKWPLELLVVGRHLQSVEFVHAPLHVGTDTDIAIAMETVGCDLGTGTLEVFWGPDKNAADNLLACTIPLSEPTDPEIENKLVSQCKWPDCVLFAPAHIEAPPAGAAGDNGLAIHRISIHLPPLPKMGVVRARVSWPQPALSANKTNAEIETADLPVSTGIAAVPSVAVVGEAVSVTACSKQDLGGGVTVEVYRNGSLLEELPLEAKNAADGAPSGPFEYRGKFRPIAPGKYEIRVDPDSDSARILTNKPIVVAYFGARLIERDPIKLFAGRPPFWWSLLNSGPAPCWEVSRPQAWTFGDASGKLRDVRLKHSGIFQREIGQWSPRAADAEPTARCTSGAKPVEAHAWLPVNGEMELGVDLALPPETVSLQPTTLGLQTCRARLLVDARDGNGQPIQRVIHLPFVVDVDTADRGNVIGALVVGGLVLAILLVAVVVWRVARGARPISGGQIGDESERGRGPSSAWQRPSSDTVTGDGDSEPDLL